MRSTLVAADDPDPLPYRQVAQALRALMARAARPAQSARSAKATLAADSHVYLSTGCLHGFHDYCASGVRGDGGPKRPAQCKFCHARCICSCHDE